MPRTRPFSELADKIKADPVRRQRIEKYKREMREALAEEKRRNPPPESDQDEGRSTDHDGNG
jgi:hypothetical protein